LENIVVAEEFRHQGIGRRLLTEFIEHARVQNGKGVFLEVRESNQNARALYSRLGFETAGSRKAYYSNPLEDAVLYRLALWPDILKRFS
jgi:ribosomal-protein-alanine N-acetyltransferase